MSEDAGSVSNGKKNPPWSTDELILALELYLGNRSSLPGPSSAEVTELSKELNELGRSLYGNRQASFRNPNGVSMKLGNFQRFDPVAQARGLRGLPRGNKLEEVVWNEFADDPQRLRETSAAIRAAILLSEDDLESTEDLEGDAEAAEGRLLTRIHQTRERSRKLVKTRKEQVIKKRGKLECEGCGFDFEKVYGSRGSGFIEAHHVKPVHSLGKGERTKASDLALVCANCHRMIHSKRPWLTMDELRAILAEHN